MKMKTNSVGQEGLTPLALACKEGNTDIVYQLVAAGAYVNLQVLSTPTSHIQAEYHWLGFIISVRNPVIQVIVIIAGPKW